MKKFSIYESKTFYPDPSIIKKYASFIIPLYLMGELNCDQKFIDEWLEMNKGVEKKKNQNVLCDLEILAVKNLFDNPTTPAGFTQMKNDIDNKCLKLEVFLRKYYTKF